jgi:hypothetical protein
MKQRRLNETICTKNTDKNKLLNRYSKNGGKVEKKFSRNNNIFQSTIFNQDNKNNMRYPENHPPNRFNKPVPLMSLSIAPSMLSQEETKPTVPSPNNQPISSNNNTANLLKNSNVNKLSNTNSRYQHNNPDKTNNKPNVFISSNNKNFSRKESPPEKEANLNRADSSCSNPTPILARPKLMNATVKMDQKNEIKHFDNIRNKLQTNSNDCLSKKEIKPNSAAAAALEIANRSNTKSLTNVPTKISANAINYDVQMPDCSKPPPFFSSSKEQTEKAPSLPLVNQYQAYITAPVYPLDPLSAAYSSYWSQWQTHYWQWASMNQMALSQKFNLSTELNPASKPS